MSVVEMIRRKDQVYGLHPLIKRLTGTKLVVSLQASDTMPQRQRVEPVHHDQLAFGRHVVDRR